MNGRRLDLLGKRFNKVVVVSFFSISERNNSLWDCVCDCGGTKVFAGYQLLRGKIFS